MPPVRYNHPARRIRRAPCLADARNRAPCPMNYYRCHVFFCCNQREAPEACCANHGAANLQAYAKERIKALGLNGKGKVRMNKSGCLDRCDEGPILVVYPDAIWYTYVDRSDIDEIIDSHVVGGRIVERLRI
jgi:(2Fe-2S) ferredoxin